MGTSAVRFGHAGGKQLQQVGEVRLGRQAMLGQGPQRDGGTGDRTFAAAMGGGVVKREKTWLYPWLP